MSGTQSSQQRLVHVEVTNQCQFSPLGEHGWKSLPLQQLIYAYIRNMWTLRYFVEPGGFTLCTAVPGIILVLPSPPCVHAVNQPGRLVQRTYLLIPVSRINIYHDFCSQSRAFLIGSLANSSDAHTTLIADSFAICVHSSSSSNNESSSNGNQKKGSRPGQAPTSVSSNETNTAATSATSRPTSMAAVAPFLSVRTAFDLYLRALKLPRGSVVICSALTIPDIVTIFEEHGLVLVPVDLDPDTLAPGPGALEDAVERCSGGDGGDGGVIGDGEQRRRVRAIYVAHVFGAQVGSLALATCCYLSHSV